MPRVGRNPVSRNRFPETEPGTLQPQNPLEPIETRNPRKTCHPEPVPGTWFFPGTAPARPEHTEIYIVQRPDSILLLGITSHKHKHTGNINIFIVKRSEQPSPVNISSRAEGTLMLQSARQWRWSFPTVSLGGFNRNDCFSKNGILKLLQTGDPNTESNMLKPLFFGRVTTDSERVNIIHQGLLFKRLAMIG